MSLKRYNCLVASRITHRCARQLLKSSLAHWLATVDDLDQEYYDLNDSSGWSGHVPDWYEDSVSAVIQQRFATGAKHFAAWGNLRERLHLSKRRPYTHKRFFVSRYLWRRRLFGGFSAGRSKNGTLQTPSCKKLGTSGRSLLAESCRGKVVETSCQNFSLHGRLTRFVKLGSEPRSRGLVPKTRSCLIAGYSGNGRTWNGSSVFLSFSNDGIVSAWDSCFSTCNSKLYNLWRQ